MTKEVSNREICFVRTWAIKKNQKCCLTPPPPPPSIPIRVKRLVVHGFCNILPYIYRDKIMALNMLTLLLNQAGTQGSWAYLKSHITLLR